ncbi:MAG: hypothetical protein SCALA702_14580 [Melioribacteraceae bacterium]|nr:MAG: hypothetical protein SCALA702_14580 [Melioribacteraceae bacterium]
MKKVLLLFITISSIAFAQYNGNEFGISASWSYTTSSKLFYFPNAEDPFLRNQSVSLEDINSIAFELKYRVSEAIITGLNIGYVDHSGYIKPVTAIGESGIVSLDASDGFNVIPVELTLYYFLPFSSDRFKFYMGGGAGFYIGNHTRSLGTLEVENIKRENAYGIHVMVGMDYMIFDFLSVKGEMKFRDPEFEVVNNYKNNTITYRGKEYFVSGNKYDAAVNIDGVMFTMGVAYHFSLSALGF